MLLGRGPELERVSRLVTEARQGNGGALHIVGEPGIGKTSLLARAIDDGGDLRVIMAGGIEAEANLPYACLGETAAPLLDGLGSLSNAQADAIRAALALGPSPGAPSDRFATCAAFLNLLSGAAKLEPLLIVIDDAQWLDSPSAECLGYAARRLANTRVGLLVRAATGPCSGRAWRGCSSRAWEATIPGLWSRPRCRRPYRTWSLRCSRSQPATHLPCVSCPLD